MDVKAEPEGKYKMRTFAQLTGLSPTVLRAWERRHGLLEPARPGGGHRLYTDEDLQVIHAVNGMLKDGRSIGEIAALGREQLLDQLDPTRSIPREAATSPIARLQEQIIQAAQDFDATLLSEVLDLTFAKYSMDVALDEVIQPATYRVGKLWEQGVLTVASEHMLSSALAARLEQLRQAVSLPNRQSQKILCCCLPGEQHEMGLLVLSLHLASAGYRVIYLGRNLPLYELKSTAEKLDIKAVCLSAKRREVLLGCLGELSALAKAWKGKIRIHLGGLDFEPAFAELTESGLRFWPPGFDKVDFLAEIYR